MLRVEQLESREVLASAGFADVVIDYQPGRGAAAPWDNPNQALGSPDDDSMPGTYVALGEGGSIELGFHEVQIANGPGTDFVIHEEGARDGASVAISNDGGRNYCSVGEISGTVEMDLEKLKECNLQTIDAIRITDDGSIDSYTSAHAGFDLNAIEVIHSEPGNPWMPGDANKDFRFDTADIGQVALANKYGTGEAATWEEGDWNGDGVFDQFDIIAALETGNYLKGPH